MELDELLALLDVDSPAELVYFEQYADLMENENDIPVETLSALVEEMDSDVLSEITDNYFDDMLGFIPDDAAELYTLIHTVGTTLASLAKTGETDAEDSTLKMYAEELYKFRNWLLDEGICVCTNTSTEEVKELNILEALISYRVSNLTDEDYQYDFSGALDYPIDEYIISLSALAEDSYDDEDYDLGDDYDEGSDPLDKGDPFWEH
ncbi:MAG: hypothetical protein LBN34_04925 [Clostridiales Family XIII bacterium]|jgi:hypothetical protein|nr:hypothetical protein [Clostridiales Family XIII bacterium]